MSFVGGSIAWRLPVGCQMFFAFLVIFLVLGLPESPRWLLKASKNKQALDVPCDIYDLPPDADKVQNEHGAILKVLEDEHGTAEYRWSQLLKHGE